jgi:hypothetical protein
VFAGVGIAVSGAHVEETLFAIGVHGPTGTNPLLSGFE